MLIKIQNTPILKRKKPFPIQLNTCVQNKIKENWKKFIKGKEGYWDGNLLAVTNFDIEQNIIEIGKAKFSWLIYSKDNNDLDIRSLFVSILFKTLDEQYVVIKNNHNKINIIGGIVEESDLENDKFNPETCLRRELKEELNLELHNLDDVKYYKMQYLKTPNPGRNYGIVYTGILNFTSKDLIDYFNKIKEKIDNEIVELLLLNKEDVKKLKLNDNDISYLKELIEYEYRV